mgnify:CR=1 FL=1
MARDRTRKQIRDEILDELLEGYDNPEDLLGKDGLLNQLRGRLVERVLDAELTDHLGYDKHDPDGYGTGNSRNGRRKKTLRDDTGQMEIEVPRDRTGTFEPQLVPKHTSRMPSFDEKVLSLYSRGMSTREIQGHLEELYSTDVSPALISRVTDAVVDDVTAWQNRSLHTVYPIVYLDALVAKGRKERQVQNRAVYMALGINMDGEKEVLGLWIAQTEGAKFWLGVMTELRNRGVQDIFVCCVDGLKGFPEAIETVFPETSIQLCIVHMVRNSLRYVPWKQRKAVAADLKTIYRAATVEEAEMNLHLFSETWDESYPTISRSWRANWERLIPFFAYPAEIRKVIYTTNAVESLNYSPRRVLKTRGSMPSDEAILKLLYLAIQRAAKKWTRPIQNWKAALNRFAIMFEDRMPVT